MKRIRGKHQPLTEVPSALRFLLFAFPILAFQVARALAAEPLIMEGSLVDLIDQAHALTLPKITLIWQTAPPRMPIPPPAT